MLISLPRKEETGKSSFFRISQSTFNATTILTSLIFLERREEGGGRREEGGGNSEREYAEAHIM